MAELGRVERPAAESFIGKKKLYCVPSVYPIAEAPEDYNALVTKYWDEVERQLEKIEVAGKIKRIFSESIFIQGEAALEILSKTNEHATRIIKRKMEEGATLLPLEDENIFGPFLDWSNCLHVVRTQEVFDTILEFYTELSGKRLHRFQEVIENNLPEGEAGLLIIRDEDRIKLQFPADIEVFLVTPPAYDDLLRWIRDNRKESAE